MDFWRNVFFSHLAIFSLETTDKEHQIFTFSIKMVAKCMFFKKNDVTMTSILKTKQVFVPENVVFGEPNDSITG